MIDTHHLQELLQLVPHPPEEPLPSGVGDDECDGFSRRTAVPGASRLEELAGEV